MLVQAVLRARAVGALTPLLVAVAVAVLVGGCANGNTTAIQGQIQGLVRAGPTCPVERADQPCPPSPVAGEIRAKDAGGAVIASTRTDTNGHYVLTVKPGAYTLAVDVGGPFPTCPAVPVTVRAAVTSSVNIDCDTGIR